MVSVVLISCVIWYYNVSHSTLGGITYYTKKQWFYDLIVLGGDATLATRMAYLDPTG